MAHHTIAPPPYIFLPSIPDITQNPKSPTAAWVQHNITQENKKGVGRGSARHKFNPRCFSSWFS